MRREWPEPFADDRRECIHGAVGRCGECEAAADEYLSRERAERIEGNAKWFLIGMTAGIAVAWVFPLVIAC